MACVRSAQTWCFAATSFWFPALPCGGNAQAPLVALPAFWGVETWGMHALIHLNASRPAMLVLLAVQGW